MLRIAQLKLFNINCTITPYKERPQVFQCTKCGMYSHHTSSCRQPRCMLCSSKSHHTNEHPSEEKLKCVNCKGDHPSNHKSCTARRIRLGLKPIPTEGGKPQQRRPREKGKPKKTQLENHQPWTNNSM